MTEISILSNAKNFRQDVVKRRRLPRCIEMRDKRNGTYGLQRNVFVFWKPVHGERNCGVSNCRNSCCVCKVIQQSSKREYTLRLFYSVKFPAFTLLYSNYSSVSLPRRHQKYIAPSERRKNIHTVEPSHNLPKASPPPCQ